MPSQVIEINSLEIKLLSQVLFLTFVTCILYFFKNLTFSGYEVTSKLSNSLLKKKKKVFLIGGNSVVV